MDKRADLALAVAIVGFGVWYFYIASQITAGRIYDPLHEGGLPKFLAAVMVLGGILLIVNRLRLWKREPGWLVDPEGETDEPGLPASFRRVLAAWLMVFVYIFSLPYLGYLIATPLLLAAALALLQVRDWRQLVGIPLGLTVVLYFAFAVLFKIGLPVGLLSFVRF